MAGTAGMQSETFIGSESGRSEPGREISRGRTRRDPNVPMTCCGRPMESRLAHARDRSGQTLFVAVWRCPVCERVTF
jgi:hypothetical protein